jgi:hypothetical protein
MLTAIIYLIVKANEMPHGIRSVGIRYKPVSSLVNFDLPMTPSSRTLPVLPCQCGEDLGVTLPPKTAKCFAP